MSRPAPPPLPLHTGQPATLEHPFIQGFNVHPHDFALIAEAAALHKVSVQAFAQLATYCYARDWMQTCTHAAPDNGPPARVVPPIG